MRLRNALFFSAAVILVGVALTVQADVPQMINYQGVLLDSGGQPVTTPVNVIFAIWDAEIDGDSVWSEPRIVTPDANGAFSVLLGEVTSIGDEVFSVPDRWLSTKVEADPEMTPRQRLASVAYAYRDNDWELIGDVLYTQGEWGIARAGNVLYGDHDRTHVNLGVACTTGASGQDHQYATVGGGDGNTASNWLATVGGGKNNIASFSIATIGGGVNNTASGNYTTVGGGNANTASQTSATVGGGYYNTASAIYATVGGGWNNTASGLIATIPGGWNNTAQGSCSFAAGRRAKANHYGTFVWGDYTDADFASTGINQFLIRAGGGVGIGTNSPSEQLEVNGTVKMTGFDLPTGAADGYVLTSDAGGVGTWQAASGGGSNWTLIDDVLFTSGEYGIARAGNVLYGDHDSTHVNLGVASTTGASGQDYKYATVGGGASNTAGGFYATVGGGYHNTASGGTATVGGGKYNIASGGTATVSGGSYSAASSAYATVGGGAGNTASGENATVGGGSHNAASGGTATVGGGGHNAATSFYTTVGGGNSNAASGGNATIPGGFLNAASGLSSFAAGTQAKANHNGTFVWGDSYDGDVASSAANQFTVRASGGTRFFSNTALTSGVQLAAGGGSWSSISDRNLKENFEQVDGADVLARIAALPISTWNYKAQDESIRHLGPMAQDVFAAFSLGEDDRHITTVDADGIALAAIQALYSQNAKQRKRIEELEARLAEIHASLQELLAERR